MEVSTRCPNYHFIPYYRFLDLNVCYLFLQKFEYTKLEILIISKVYKIDAFQQKKYAYAISLAHTQTLALIYIYILYIYVAIPT